MGRYINTTSQGILPINGKADVLMKDGAVLLSKAPENFIPNLVCVVKNPAFEAAAFCHDEDEFYRFVEDNSGRSKKWLIYEHADEFAFPRY